MGSQTHSQKQNTKPGIVLTPGKKRASQTASRSRTGTGNAEATGVKLKVSGKGVSFNTSVGEIAAAKSRTVKIKLKPKKPGKIEVSLKVTAENAGGKTVTKKIKVKK